MVKVRPYRKRNVEGWEVDIVTTLPTGEVVRERVKSPVTGKTAALRWGRAREAAIQAQGGRNEKTRDEKTLTVGTYLRGWIDAREVRGLSSHRDDKGRILNQVIPALGRLRLAQLRPHDVRDFLRTMRTTPSPKGGTLAPRTLWHLYFLLRQAMHDAVVDELVPANPVQVKRGDLPAKTDKDPAWRKSAVFSREEAEAVISDPRIPEQRRVEYALDFLTGARTGEVSALRWRDYDPTLEPLGRLTVLTAYNSRLRREKGTKTGTTRTVPVHPTLAKVLASWRLTGWRKEQGRAPKPDDLIIPAVEGGCRNVGWALKLWHADLELLGLRRRRHYDTRRTFISLAIGDGARKDLLRWVTHAPADMFDAYTTPPWPALCEAVACLRVELREGRVVTLRPPALGDAVETPEAESESRSEVV